MNAHKTICVVHPEFNSNSQLIFRDNLTGEIAGKNVMILMASITNGKTLNKVLECLQYYGAWDHRDCPMCRAGEKAEALVNAYGYARLDP